MTGIKSKRAQVLRKQAAEFRKLARTFSSAEMRERLEALADQCELIADDIDRGTSAGGEC